MRYLSRARSRVHHSIGRPVPRVRVNLLAAIWCLATICHADSPPLPTSFPSNHALIITVSEYPRSPLPGVLTDRKLGFDLARRLGVPEANIVDLSEHDVTREGLKNAIEGLSRSLRTGDRVFVYYSGHGARFFDPSTQQCEEGIVMQDMHVVPKSEFSRLLKPLSAKADKTLVMLDSCHAGGVAQAAGSRALGAVTPRAKFSRDASSPQCSAVVNGGSLSQTRGLDLATTDNNLVVLAAARKNEVRMDTSKGGALTFNFAECLGGGATDTDHSGSVSMNELAACVQARLDKTQDESMRQHVTLGGNGALVPAFAPSSMSTAIAAGPTEPIVALPAPVDTLATLKDIYAQRDDRWIVELGLDQPSLKIGSNLGMTVRSARDGYVYIFYRGSQPDSFYLLFPNALDAANAIVADQGPAVAPQGLDRDRAGSERYGHPSGAGHADAARFFLGGIAGAIRESGRSLREGQTDTVGCRPHCADRGDASDPGRLWRPIPGHNGRAAVFYRVRSTHRQHRGDAVNTIDPTSVRAGL